MTTSKLFYLVIAVIFLGTFFACSSSNHDFMSNEKAIILSVDRVSEIGDSTLSMDVSYEEIEIIPAIDEGCLENEVEALECHEVAIDAESDQEVFFRTSSDSGTKTICNTVCKPIVIEDPAKIACEERGGDYIQQCTTAPIDAVDAASASNDVLFNVSDLETTCTYVCVKDPVEDSCQEPAELKTVTREVCNWVDIIAEEASSQTSEVLAKDNAQYVCHSVTSEECILPQDEPKEAWEICLENGGTWVPGILAETATATTEDNTMLFNIAPETFEEGYCKYIIEKPEEEECADGHFEYISECYYVEADDVVATQESTSTAMFRTDADLIKVCNNVKVCVLDPIDDPDPDPICDYNERLVSKTVCTDNITNMDASSEAAEAMMNISSDSFCQTILTCEAISEKESCELAGGIYFQEEITQLVTEYYTCDVVEEASQVNSSMYRDLDSDTCSRTVEVVIGYIDNCAIPIDDPIEDPYPPVYENML